MPKDLLKPEWREKISAAELRFLLVEIIGGPGQTDRLVSGVNTFYLPLAGPTCQVRLIFSEAKEISAVEAGPAFNPERWDQVVKELAGTHAVQIGREFSLHFASLGRNGQFGARQHMRTRQHGPILDGSSNREWSAPFPPEESEL